MTDHREQVEALLADYRRGREQLVSVQRELRAIAESATSKDGLVTATVGGRGTLVGLTIADDAYHRLRPAELATVVLGAVTDATAKALAAAQQAMVPVLPLGADPAAVLAGTGELRPDEFLAPPVVPVPARIVDDDRDEDSYEHTSWMDNSSGGQR